MQIVQQAVTRSTWPVAGGVTLVAMVLLHRPSPELAVSIPDVPSVEVPVQTERFLQRAHEPVPPAPTTCSLDGRSGSGERRRSALEWFRGLSDRDRRIAQSICSIEDSQPCPGLRAPANVTETEQHENDQALEQSLRLSRRSLRQLLSRLPEAERGCAVDYCDAIHTMPLCDTPLVVTFDAQPIVFAATHSTFAFQPGVPVASDWPTAATPWIAIDLDHDGAITSGAELFGDATRLPDGRTASNGFAALAALDTNADGVLDAADPAFGSLLLWADRNFDRASTPDELRPLGEIVTAIPLANRITPRCDARGNCEGERGSLQWRDDSGAARTGAVVDVYLRRR